jgi:EAL domain-containing protein (putative c-di-GMP-specific phosphodiesterase class I)/GGDEF domain-containing protein
MRNWNLDLACPGFQVLQDEVFSALVTTGRTQELYTELLSADGACVPCHVELNLHGGDSGGPVFFDAVYRKIEDKPSLPPEKLPSDFFQESLRMALLRAARHPRYFFAVLCIGIDNAGQTPLHADDADRFAAMLSKRISNCLRIQDIPAGIDSERCSILLDNVAGVIETVRVAQRIQEETGRSFRVGRQELRVTCSIGVVMGPGNYTDADEMLRDAEIALNRAMQRGVRRIAVFDEHQNSTAVRFFHVEQGLRNALIENDVRMHFQPILDLEAGDFCGAEALMRWNHKRDGLQRAEWFLPLAGHSDVFLELETWGVRRALESLARLQQLSGETFYLGLNISFKNILRRGFLEEMLKCCEENQIKPASVSLELREERVRQLADGYAEVLDRIRQAGLGIVPDHFTARHLSLADLLRLPLRGLKLDPEVLADSSLRATILSVARSRGLSLTATGVEASGRLEELRELGFSAAQGNALAVDMEERELYGLLRRRS